MNPKAASPGWVGGALAPDKQCPVIAPRDSAHARLNRRLTALTTNRDTTIRRAGLCTVLVALALLAAACGGTRSPAAAGSSPENSSASGAVAYSACMRSHGVPAYPDPEPDGSLPKGNAQAFGVTDSQYQAAQRACQYLLPSSDTTFAASLIQCLQTGDCPPAVVQRALTEGRRFAQCMRSDGVQNWPDPTIDSIGRPSFQVTAAGISIAATRSSQMLAKIGHCQSQPGTVLLRME